jgi:molecular chaperone HscB
MFSDLSRNHFELFGLPQSFALDEELLDRRYRELQRLVHPDRYVNGTDQERRLSMQRATQINEAYRVLKDPLQRGRYLLELAGYPFGDGQHTTRDPEFLMEQMELRERLDEIRHSKGAVRELDEFIDNISLEIKLLSNKLGATLDNLDDTASAAAADIVLRMQFYRRLEQEALELEVDLEDMHD